MLTNFTRKIASATILFTLIYAATEAQTPIRPYTLVYSENLRGGTTMFGNTVMHIVDNGIPSIFKMNETSSNAGNSVYGNDGENMTVIDIDANPETGNSSSADLILPAGTNDVKFARLYWGGRISSSVVTNAPDTLRKIKIRKGSSGNYLDALAPATNIDFFNAANGDVIFQSYIDVTNFIDTNGTGTYTVANLSIDGGPNNNGGKFGAWSIVVAYENTAESYNSIRIYEGYSQIGSTLPLLNVTLTGLNVPNNPLVNSDAVMTTMTWEGDANFAGDFLKVNNVSVTNAMNPATNFYNGSITKNGINITTKNPNYSNQMGVDIDEVFVGTGFNILPNATTVNVTFGTELDQFFPSLFTFKIKVKDPVVILDKSVSDANGNGFVDANEELTYILSGSNEGTGVAFNTVIVDTLPSSVTYVPNTLEVINGGGVSAGFKTDAENDDEAFKATFNGKTYVKFFLGQSATPNTGGQLAPTPNGAFSVRFKVLAGAVPEEIINTARIISNSLIGDLFTDDGTAIIVVDGGSLPVNLLSFKASKVNNNVLLNWSTTSELNNDYFILERSDDGIHFTGRGRVAGSGTTSFKHDYQYNDALNTLSPVVYYRLKIVDTDGKYGFSKIIAIKLNGTFNNEDVSVYPNPFVSNIKVAVKTAADEMATFRILSFDGKEMLFRKVALQTGDNIVVLTNFGAIAKGNYILEVTTSTNKFIKKIIKN